MRYKYLSVVLMFVMLSLALTSAASADNNAMITLTPNNSLLISGSPLTFNVIVSGGTGPFNVTLYNTTNSADMKQSQSLLLQLSQFTTNQTTGTNNNESVPLPNYYGLYLCEGASILNFSAPITPYSWVNDSSQLSVFGTGIAASIGHQTNSTCVGNGLDSFFGAETAMAGIGLNEQPGSYTLYNSPFTLDPIDVQLPFTVTADNSFVVIMATVGDGVPNPPFFGPLESVSLPTGCSTEVFVNNTNESSYIAVCSNQFPEAEPLTPEFTYQEGSVIAAAAYVFSIPPANTGNSSTISLGASSQGIFSYNATANDLGTTTPFLFNSVTSNIVVLFTDNGASLTAVPSNANLDSGQYETYNFYITGGTGPFTVQLFNITGDLPQGSNILIQSPGGSNTISFATSNTGVFSYNAIATDQGTTSNYVFNSTSSSFSVSSTTTTSTTTVATTTVSSGGGIVQSGGGNPGITTTPTTTVAPTTTTVSSTTINSTTTIESNNSGASNSPSFIRPPSTTIATTTAPQSSSTIPAPKTPQTNLPTTTIIAVALGITLVAVIVLALKGFNLFKFKF